METLTRTEEKSSTISVTFSIQARYVHLDPCLSCILQASGQKSISFILSSNQHYRSAAKNSTMHSSVLLNIAEFCH